jgi:hypothetical protein
LSEVIGKAGLSKLVSAFQPEGFTAKYDKEDVFQFFPGTRSIIVQGTPELRQQVQDSIDRTGLRELDAQYNPSSEAELSSRDFGHVIARSGEKINKTTQLSSGDFGEWLMKVGMLEGKGVRLILDTNMIMRHYVRNQLAPRLGTEALKGCLSIPRLALLEIERMFNESKHDTPKRRLALFAAREILFLRELSSEFLPELKDSRLEAFSKIAGEKFTDAWIRREAKEYWHRVATGTIFRNPILFATCDLMNALAASAEGLAVLYFSRREEKDSYAYSDVSQVAELIMDLAVSLGRIQISDVAYQGVWEGKTIWEWEADCVRRVKP